MSPRATRGTGSHASRWVLIVALSAGTARAAELGGEEAAGRLDPYGPGRSRRGFWGVAGAVAREALPGGSEWRLAMGFEPDRGAGFAIDASALGGSGIVPVLGLEGTLVHRDRGRRLIVGGGTLRCGRYSRAHLVGGISLPLAPAIQAGLRVRLFPGERGWAPDPRLDLAAVLDPWLGRIELGGETRVGIGVRVSSGVWWTARLAARAPAMGLAWRVGGVELSAEEERHPHLGRVSRFALALGGRRR